MLLPLLYNSFSISIIFIQNSVIHIRNLKSSQLPIFYYLVITKYFEGKKYLCALISHLIFQKND